MKNSLLFQKPLGQLRRELPGAFLGCAQPEAEARHLLCHYLGLSHSWMITHVDATLTAEEQGRGLFALEARLKGEPWAYIEGFAVFDNRKFAVGPGVLVPREDSLPLLDAMMPLLPQGARFVDWCAGSGALGLTLAARREDVRGVLVEKSPAALRYAWLNRRFLGLQDRVALVHGCDERALPYWQGQVFLANPPYITDAEMQTLSAEVAREPKMALAGGSDGLALYPQLIRYCGAHLEVGGIAGFEFGSAAQGDQIDRWLEDEGFERLAWCEDLGGNRRSGIWRRLI